MQQRHSGCYATNLKQKSITFLWRAGDKLELSVYLRLRQKSENKFKDWVVLVVIDVVGFNVVELLLLLLPSSLLMFLTLSLMSTS